MKILEAQNALVSNYEVYERLLEQQVLKKKENKKLPSSLATLTKEVCSTGLWFLPSRHTSSGRPP